jgi:hypothetical protein
MKDTPEAPAASRISPIDEQVGATAPAVFADAIASVIGGPVWIGLRRQG